MFDEGGYIDINIDDWLTSWQHLLENEYYEFTTYDEYYGFSVNYQNFSIDENGTIHVDISYRPTRSVEYVSFDFTIDKTEKKKTELPDHLFYIEE